MQDGMTDTAVEPRMTTYGVAWRLLTDRCESMTERCRHVGEGWVIDPRRPPAIISIAYLCEKHAQVAIANHERLGVKARFVRGQADGPSRWLNIEWRVLEDD